MSIFEIRSFLGLAGYYERHENGLKLSIRDRIVRTSPTVYELHGWDDPDHRERLRILGTLGIRVLVTRGRISFLLVRRRGRRLLLHISFRTKARIEHE